MFNIEPLKNTPLSTLRRYVRPRAEQVLISPVVLRPKKPHPCELCGAALAQEHGHFLDLRNGELVCVCRACGLLFHDHNLNYKPIKQLAELLTTFQMTDMQWNSLMIPIDLAFFLRSSTTGRVIALYPSPAGATESTLELESWQDLVDENPVLNEFESDVEALLVNRIGGKKEHYRLSIDRCYELIGLIRIHWRGLSGGSEVWERIQLFFDGLNG